MMQNQKVNSCIYKGNIRHRRFTPLDHVFEYPIFMLYLDLDELPALFKSKRFCSVDRLNVVSFYRKDFFHPDTPSLKQAVKDEVIRVFLDKEETAPEIATVRALMHVRYFYYAFNPVVFYYCFNGDDQLVAILAEITNTPWGERHHYVLPACHASGFMSHKVVSNQRHVYQFEKQFHVSPFNPMNMTYRWMFSAPDETLHVHMINTIQAGSDAPDINKKHFDATLKLERKEFHANISKTLIRFPFMTVKVVVGIYWQAFKLWVRQTPFYDHPGSGTDR